MPLLCRTCGGRIHGMESPNIFHEENADVLEQVELLSGLTLLKDPHLPTQICHSCLIIVDQAMQFRECCNRTQEQLMARQVRRSTHTVVAEDSDSVEDEYFTDQKSNAQTDNEGEELNNDYFDDPLDEIEELLTFDDRAYIESDTTDLKSQTSENADGEDEDILVSRLKSELYSVCSELQEDDEKIDSTMRNNKYSSSANAASIIKHTTNSIRKPYVVWKNLTLEEKIERKRQMRRRDCVCDQCGRYFTDQSNFKLHLTRHTGIKNFACAECDKRFYTEHLLSLHVRVAHRGERPYACKFCERTFHNSTTRVIHERIHTNSRPYSCAHCGKSFSSTSGRKRHELIHTGDRPFKCNICSQSFQRKTHLIAHNRSKQHKRNATIFESEVQEFGDLEFV